MRQMLLTCALLLCAMMLHAQKPSASTHEQVVATVVDRSGNPVSGLTASNFRAEFLGKPVTVGATEKNTWPAIVLLLDASGSMAGPGYDKDRWIVALRAASAIVNATPADARITLIMYASRVVGVKQGREQILEVLGPLETHPPNLESDDRKTATFDTILEVIGRLGSGSSAQAIYVLSDGGENVHPGSVTRVRRALIALKIRLFALIPPEQVRPPEIRDGAEAFTALAPSTGGTAEVLAPVRWTDPERQRVARQIAQISHFYELDLTLPEAPAKPHGWKLEVVDENGKRRGDVKVFYPRELQPCATKQP